MRIVIVLVVMVIMAIVAKKKGFNPFLWILAAGLPGLVILACMPSAEARGIDKAKRAQRKKTGNVVGGILTGIAVALIVVLVLMISSDDPMGLFDVSLEVTLRAIIRLSYPLINLALVIVTITRKSLPGKPWILTHLTLGLLLNVMWLIPRLLVGIDGFDFDLAKFYELFNLPLSVVGLINSCLLFPFIIIAAKPAPIAQNIVKEEGG